MKGKMLFFFLVLFTAVVVLTANVFAASDTILCQGMRSDEVTELQNDLKAIGYFQHSSTGYFGPITYQAVLAYQKANGLLVDGKVGNMTKREITADKMLVEAKRYIGVPYEWGGSDPSGFDCSGFTKYVFSQVEYYIPRTAELQYAKGYTVSKSQLKSGDLVFFTTYKAGPSHVGIVTDNQKFIHASSSKGITITDLNNSYYTQRYVGAKRVLV